MAPSKEYSSDWLLAFAGGLLLTLMINYNSVMAKYSTPLLASWIAHGIGAIVSFLFVVLFSKTFVVKKAPLWAYLGGIPGAMTVVLAAITVNSKLGLSGTLALILVGQVMFGLVSDIFGLFGTPKRRFVLVDFFIMLSVLTGSWIIIFCRS